MQRLTLGLAMAWVACTAVSAAEAPQPANSAVPATAAAASSTPTKKPAAPPATWPDADIAVAKARCNALLRNIEAVVVPEAPFRNGSCGTPSPVRLISIGKNPEIALSPPPVLTCDMVAALATWLAGDVQPLAKKHLGEPVIRIETMSDYSCRAAYGRAGNKLSEHGRANALDIRGFVTAKGQSAFLLESWGKTGRDIARDIAVAKANAEKAERARAAEVIPNPEPPPVAAASDVARPEPVSHLSAEGLAAGAVEAVRGIVRSTIIDGTGKSGQPAENGSTPAFTGHGLAPPSRLGGPGQAATDPVAEPAPSPVSGRKSRFLREVHDAACRVFGTTLGPEANEAHRNHLHVDMAERKAALKICDR